MTVANPYAWRLGLRLPPHGHADAGGDEFVENHSLVDGIDPVERVDAEDFEFLVFFFAPPKIRKVILIQ